MDVIHQVVDLFLHLDAHLAAVLSTYGGWTYLILFAIIFAETGLVVTPFLPGDSLLFAAGALAARVESLSIGALFVLLAAAAILGNLSNYAIGHFFGKRLLAQGSRAVNPKHLERTHAFFEKYGGKTIVFARFMPILRTVAPFVAGLGAMTRGRFFWFSCAGGAAWVAACLFSGFFFGQIPAVQKHFSLVVLAIVFVSLLPAIFEILKHSRSKA
ncbi:MAG: DedA family protein [bacterium]